MIYARPSKALIGLVLIASSILVLLRVMLTYRTSIDIMGPLLPLVLGTYMGGCLVGGLFLLRSARIS
jgi:hypothetical protein